MTIGVISANLSNELNMKHVARQTHERITLDSASITSAELNMMEASCRSAEDNLMKVTETNGSPNERST